MPFYEYQCKNCGHALEAMQKVNDSPLRKCPECGKVHAAAIDVGAGFPPEGRRLVRDGLQDGQGRQAQSRRSAGNGRPKEDKKETKEDKVKEAAAKDAPGDAAKPPRRPRRPRISRPRPPPRRVARRRSLHRQEITQAAAIQTQGRR